MSERRADIYVAKVALRPGFYAQTSGRHINESLQCTTGAFAVGLGECRMVSRLPTKAGAVRQSIHNTSPHIQRISTQPMAVKVFYGRRSLRVAVVCSLTHANKALPHRVAPL